MVLDGSDACERGEGGSQECTRAAQKGQVLRRSSWQVGWQMLQEKLTTANSVKGSPRSAEGAQRDKYLGEVAGRGELADALLVVAKASGGEGFPQVQEGSTRRQVLGWGSSWQAR